VNKRVSSTQRRPLVSLNIDVANLPREAIEKLVEIAPQQGRVVISHAFGDFRREDMDDLAVELYQFGFRLVHCPAWPTQRGRLKSVVDDVMAQDMRDQLEYAPEIEVFIVASGDRNFIAVVNALKRHGKRVVVAADQESINRELRLCADEYLALPRLRGRYRSFAAVEPEPVPQLPSDGDLLLQLSRLDESTDYLTLRKILRALTPQESAGDERFRAALTDRVNALAESGYISTEKRSIKGRMVNTLVLNREKILGLDLVGSGKDKSIEAKPQARRRVRGKVGVSPTS
jgi:uncharacterized LabA/DUF88 family protein